MHARCAQAAFQAVRKTGLLPDWSERATICTHAQGTGCNWHNTHAGKPAHQITPRCADKHGKHAATEQVSTTADRQVPYDGCGPLHHSLNTSGRFSCCRDNVHPTAWTRRGSRDSSPTPPTFRTNKSTTKKWLHTGAPPQPTPGGLTHIRAQKYASPLGGRHRKERHSSAAITHHPNLNPEG